MSHGGSYEQRVRELELVEGFAEVMVFPHFSFLWLLFGNFASILLANCKLMLAQVHRTRCVEVRVDKVTLDK